MIHRVFYGTREAMIAEVAAFDFTEIGVAPEQCEYLIMPDGDEQYDTEFAASFEEAKAYAKEIARGNGDVPICRID